MIQHVILLGIIAAFVTQISAMSHDRALKSVPVADPSEKVALLKTRLTRDQHECLIRCAKGISLRFERWELIDALVAAGYATQGFANVVTLTAKGEEYLRTHAG